MALTGIPRCGQGQVEGCITKVSEKDSNVGKPSEALPLGNILTLLSPPLQQIQIKTGRASLSLATIIDPTNELSETLLAQFKAGGIMISPYSAALYVPKAWDMSFDAVFLKFENGKLVIGDKLTINTSNFKKDEDTAKFAPTDQSSFVIMAQAGFAQKLAPGQVIDLLQGGNAAQLGELLQALQNYGSNLAVSFGRNDAVRLKVVNPEAGILPYQDKLANGELTGVVFNWNGLIYTSDGTTPLKHPLDAIYLRQVDGHLLISDIIEVDPKEAKTRDPQLSNFVILVPKGYAKTNGLQVGMPVKVE